MKIKAVIFSLLLCSFAFAGPHSSECVKAMVDHLKADKYDKAFDAVLDDSPFLKGNVNVSNLKMQYADIPEYRGAVRQARGFRNSRYEDGWNA